MSAQTGIAIAGGIAGGIIGGPTGAAIGFSLGNAVGGAFFGDQPGGQTLEGPRLTDTSVSSSTYGKGIQISFGKFFGEFFQRHCRWIYAVLFSQKLAQSPVQLCLELLQI